MRPENRKKRTPIPFNIANPWVLWGRSIEFPQQAIANQARSD
jgi:hypothetical protein